MDIYGSIILLSGPSGAGKSSLVKELQKRFDNIYFSVSVTTREKRGSEIDGVNYHFVSKKEFEEDIEKGFFLEWANVHGNYYGTSLKHTINALKEDKIVIFDIDVQGFLQVKKRLGKLTTSVFITTPSLEILKKRLIDRGTDTEESIKKRVKNALEELKYAKDYDFFIVNDDFNEAKEKLFKIVEISKIKTSSINLENFIKKWLR